MSKAADCLARKAYFLGKSYDYQSPWMREFQWYVDNEVPVTNEPEPEYEFIGGKHDDITITVAQVFESVPEDDPKRQLAANDKYFPD